MNYKIKIDRESGDNQVNLLKKITENTYSLEWAFTLKGDDKPIVLSEMFNEDCFVISNWNAQVRIYSVSKKELIFEKNYNGNSSASTLISDDKTKLYVSYATDDYETFIEIISLIDFSIIKTIELPKYFDVKYFTLSANDQLMFYYSERRSYDHGYNIVNEETGKIEHFLMEYPQWEKFGIKPPVISNKHNIGIMPFWGDIEIKKEGKNNPLFVFKVMLFNLTNFKVEKIIPVREFTRQQLSEYESTCEEHAKIFQDKDREGEDYKDAVKEFIEHLNSIVFDTVSDSFWVCFSGGIVRNITLDGKLSPLFVTVSKPSSTAKGAFNFPYFHSYMDSIEQNTIVLKEFEDYYKMSYNRDELSSNKLMIEKELTEKEPIKITATKKDDLAMEEANKVVIEVTDLNQEKSYLEALDKMIVLTQDIDAIKSGNLLIFRIKDKENYEEDAVFFDKAIKVEGAAVKIAQVISNLNRYKGKKYLYIDDETPAGTYAILALVHKSKNGIADYIDFLRSCDLDHEVNEIENIKEVIEKYGWCEETCRLAITRMVSCAGQHGSEQFEEFLENGLNTYLETQENRILFLKNVLREFNEAEQIIRYVGYPKEQYLGNTEMWVEFFEVVLTEKEMETLNNEVSLIWDNVNN